MSRKPLQTHGLTREMWHPPKESRFCAYDNGDEVWMKGLGLGHVEQVPERLFDVRLYDGTLVGYCESNPCQMLNLRLTIHDPHQVCVARTVGGESRIKQAPYREAELRARPWECDGQLFECWTIDSSLDAAALIESGFIKVLGKDRKEEFIYKLRRNAFMAQRLTAG